MRSKEKLSHNKSLKGYLWHKRTYNEKLKSELQQRHNISDFIAELLAMRFDSSKKVLNFLQPTLKHNMQDPYNMKYMDDVIRIIKDAINKKRRIAIFGDYDVDGATSSALLKNYFSKLNIEVGIYIPDRIEEGYGPNTNAFSKLKEEGYELVITVDCGATAFEPILAAKEMGLDILVLDHHISLGEKPEALAIVNPNQEDDNSDYGYLCAAGVGFLVIVALQSALREDKYFEVNSEPNLLEFLDLVALGTVCDVVPLVDLNRAFVATGLKQMSKGKNIGLKALAAVAGINFQEIDTYHLGYILGPRINAGGRVGKASLGAKLLSTDDEAEAYKIALELEQYNKERKAIEHIVQEEAIQQVETKQLHQKSVIISYNQAVAGKQASNWHPGVIGIVASRIKEKYNLPTAVISLTDGIGKASCRSIKGVDFGSAITKARAEGLLLNGGGHKMAAGFTVAESKLTNFSDYLEKSLKAETAKAHLEQTVNYDYDFAVSALTVDLCKELELLAPFGTDNYKPKFLLSNCKIVHLRMLADKHLKLIIADHASGFYDKTIEAILWQAVDSPFYEIITKNQRATFSFLGSIKINSWQNKEKVQFELEDIFMHNN
ncbi:MAG: single-stranded-DNA-specific exonuclease RecJ [Alphaproteobacteria bacterium]|nr:single-stranded-DNA-specific exonuclease RecJ [Alphaproteobacteria bacterium]MBT5828518.1 single-stranded-DNA-specific exonuclease RecJ [Alphaproteobacteria bacterium]